MFLIGIKNETGDNDKKIEGCLVLPSKTAWERPEYLILENKDIWMQWRSNHRISISTEQVSLNKR